MKDAYYFSHDSNAKDDPKCVMLIEQLGLEGYGIYWVLIETLRDQPEYKYPISLVPAIARRYNTTAEKMRTVIGNYGLFTIDDENFFSLSLIKRMEEYDHKRELARLAGKKSAEKRLLNAGSTDVQRAFNDRSTSKVKESKVKKRESKVEYAEKVALTEAEYQKLVDKFGEDDTKRMLEILSNYKLSSGRTYKSDYHTLIGWVKDRLAEEKRRGRIVDKPQQPKSWDALEQWSQMRGESE